jgi:hypothetical protein
VQPLRSLRDVHLESAFGATIATMYYRNMVEIGDILQNSPALRLRFNRLVRASMPVAGLLLRQGTATIAADDTAAIYDFLNDMKDAAGVQLQMDIDFILRGMESGWLLEWMGIEIEKDTD